METLGLTELHTHLGGSVAPHILWSIAHDQGFKLPVRDYRQFASLIASNAKGAGSLERYLKVLHSVTEKIQSSPMAVERCVYEVISGEYRRNNVVNMELRFNPMKRNVRGERDLDAIILAAIRGIERASTEYPVEARLIICMAREFSQHHNNILLNKAIKYREHVVGIDLAGPESKAMTKPDYGFYYRAVAKARDHNIGSTIHTGETVRYGLSDMRNIMKIVMPDRVGHGIMCVHDTELMDLVRDRGTILELCPSSNISTGAVPDIQGFGEVLRTLVRHNIKVSINTDGTYILNTGLQNEYNILVKAGIVGDDDVTQMIKRSAEYRFSHIYR